MLWSAAIDALPEWRAYDDIYNLFLRKWETLTELLLTAFKPGAIVVQLQTISTRLMEGPGQEREAVTESVRSEWGQMKCQQDSLGFKGEQGLFSLGGA